MSEDEWKVFGAQLEPRFGSTRPQPVGLERMLQDELPYIRFIRYLQLRCHIDDDWNTDVAHSPARIEPMKAIYHAVSEDCVVG